MPEWNFGFEVYIIHIKDAEGLSVQQKHVYLQDCMHRIITPWWAPWKKGYDHVYQSHLLMAKNQILQMKVQKL